jgi:quinol monooxygenase YgiN
MYCNITTLKIDQARIKDFSDLLYSPETIRTSKSMGIRDALLVQAVDQHGQLLSASLFDSQAQANQLFASPFYVELVKNLKPYLLEAPARMRLDVLVQRKFKPRIPHMYINNTIIKIDPARVDEFIQVLWAPEVVDQILKFGAFIEVFTMHSLEKPGTIHSVSSFATPEDAKLVFTDPDYAALLGKLKPFLMAAPERIGYSLVRTEEIPFTAAVV